MQDAKGNDVDLSAYKGKVLLIVNVASQWYVLSSADTFRQFKCKLLTFCDASLLATGYAEIISLCRKSSLWSFPVYNYGEIFVSMMDCIGRKNLVLYSLCPIIMSDLLILHPTGYIKWGINNDTEGVWVLYEDCAYEFLDSHLLWNVRKYVFL